MQFGLKNPYGVLRKCWQLSVFPVSPQYVQEVLRSRQPLILFLEEPPASLQLADSARRWLHRVLRALRDGAVPDVLIVPVGIAYDVAPGRMEQDGAVRGTWGRWCFPK